MSKAASRTFCCCIPVRVGVVVLSVIGLVGGAGITAMAIISLKRHEGSKAACIIQTVVYLLLALVSLFGLVGAITRKLALIRAFAGMLVAHLIFSIATGIYAIIRNFKDAPKYISDCASGSVDPNVLKTCRNGSTILKAVMIAVFILAWLIEIWACVIVANYSKQLTEEEAKGGARDTEAW